MVLRDDSWMVRAACRGRTKDMFPGKHADQYYVIRAREICASCTVRRNCLDYAMEFPMSDMHGVWAGMTREQLAAEQKRRKLKPTRPSVSEVHEDFRRHSRRRIAEDELSDE